jgi:hypothetical protein
VVVLATASAADAADGSDPDGDSKVPPPRPNLVVSEASVVPFGATQWQIHYTVTNRGTAATPSFHVAAQQNGTTLLKDSAHASLAAGASRSDTGASHVFGNIDTGDTAFFGADEGCLYVSCAGAAAPFGIGLNLQLWEQDLGQPAEILKSSTTSSRSSATSPR